jgi:AcrR family transcriptional regulator
MQQARAQRPYGRDAVVMAIQAAALELLSERGPRDVTVRDIAERAQVNHALVHRHFGTKDELVRSVLRSESAKIAEFAADQPRDAATLLALLDAHPAYFRALARAVLDSPESLQGVDLPAGAAFLDLVGEPSDRTRGIAAAAGSLALGWIVFGEHLARVLGSSDVAALRADLAESVEAMVRRARRAPSSSR